MQHMAKGVAYSCMHHGFIRDSEFIWKIDMQYKVYRTKLCSVV